MDIRRKLIPVLTVIIVLCAAVPPVTSRTNQLLEEVQRMLGKSARYRCDDSEGTVRKRICSCDRSCSRYGDCCIDIARDEPREQFTCLQLQHSGRYVWMKALCEGRRPPPLSKFKCEGQFRGSTHNFSLVIDIPAFYKPWRTLYRNVYCIWCNEGQLHGTYRWQSRLAWIGQPPPAKMPQGLLLEKSTYDADSRVNSVKYGGITYNGTFQAVEFGWENFTDMFNTAVCSPAVNTCPKGSDPVLARKCALYAAYYTPSSTPGVTYKNYHCALCNGVPLATIESDSKRTTPGGSLIPPSLGKAISNLAFDRQEGGSQFQFIFDPSPGGAGCGKNEIKVPGLNSCHPVSCPEGTRWDPTGGCVGPGGNRSCPWVVFEEQWVTVLPNHSLYLNFSNQIVGPQDYKANTWTGHVLVCVSHPVTVVLDPTQEILAEVCLALSTVCLLLLAAVYIALPHLRARASGRSVLCLAISLAIAQVLFLVSNDLPPHTTSCHVVAIALHYFYLASFFWMNALAIDICRSLATHIFDPASSRMFLWYSCYSWLCPMVLVVVAILLDVFVPDGTFSPSYGGHLCWICHRESLVVLFLVPVAILLLVNTVLFLVTARSLRSARLTVKTNRQDDQGVPFLLYVKLVMAFGLTWAFGFGAALTPARWLWYPFILLSGLQGLFLFLAFVFKKSVFCDLQQRFAPMKKIAARETSGPTTGSTGVQPSRPSAEEEEKDKEVPLLATARSSDDGVGDVKEAPLETYF